jgi:hypothetical protein
MEKLPEEIYGTVSNRSFICDYRAIKKGQYFCFGVCKFEKLKTVRTRNL